MKGKNRKIQVTIDSSQLPFVITASGNPESIDGINPLCWAARNGHEYIVQLLIQGGIDFEAYGNSAILEAIDGGHIDIVRLLLKKGINVNKKTDMSVAIAASKGYTDIIALLTDYGADLSSCNNIAIRFAAKNGHLECVKFICENSNVNEEALENSLYEAITHNQLNITKYLIDKIKFSINNSILIHSAFNIAITKGFLDVVKLLIYAGLDVNCVISGSSPIIYAVANNQYEVLKLLIDSGANITFNTYRAIKLAARCNYDEIYDLLIKKITVK